MDFTWCVIIMPHRVTGHGAEVLDGKWISPSRTGQLKLGEVRFGSLADICSAIGMSALPLKADIGSFGFRLTQTLAACHISSGRRVVW